jgi:tripartite ATP-independent transporter DctM subunit
MILTPPLIGGIGLLALFIFMAMRMPVGISFLLVGCVGTGCLTSWDIALSALARIPYTWASAYVFSCVPLFILMGMVFSKSGIAADLYRAAHHWLGRLPGGLLLASIAGCGGFAAVSGSSTAGAAAMGAICYPEMRKYDYDKGLAAGAIAAGGTLGIMIPPSLGFIVYGILTEQSIGKLFMAGVTPGILELLFFMIAVVILVKIKPHLAPVSEFKITWSQKISSLTEVWPVLGIFLLIIGGIYLGVFTPIEAGGIGAAGSIILSICMRRFSWEKFTEACLETIHITAMIFLLFMGAMVFNIFMTLSHLPQSISIMFSSIGSPQLLVLFILLLFFPLGCFLDVTSMLILTLPLFLPSLKHAGVDLIWFGVLAVLCAEIAMLTPPVGMNVFVVKGVVKDVSLEKVFIGVIPFLIANFILLVLLYLIPQISLFLPRLMGG